MKKQYRSSGQIGMFDEFKSLDVQELMGILCVVSLTKSKNFPLVNSKRFWLIRK